MALPKDLFSLGLEELCLCRHTFAHIILCPSPSQPRVALLLYYLVGQCPDIEYMVLILCAENQLAFSLAENFR